MTASNYESHEYRVEEGGQIPGISEPSYTLRAQLSPPIPVIIAVPHGGRRYPEQLLANMREPDYSALRLEDRLIDEIGAELAHQTGATLIVAHAPRAMLDLNRARDDVDWEMITGPKPHPVRHSLANRRARSGLGLVPRRLPGLGEIWRGKLTRDELNARIAGVHRPYHAALSRELESIRDEWGCALLVDLHSMPPLKQAADRGVVPRFVIGDRFGTSCDAGLVSQAYHYLYDQGQPVAHNRPYAGGYVLDTHAAPRHGIHAIQLEVCRSTYLDSRLEGMSPKANAVTKLLSGLVRELGAVTARIASPDEFRNAAE